MMLVGNTYYFSHKYNLLQPVLLLTQAQCSSSYVQYRKILKYLESLKNPEQFLVTITPILTKTCVPEAFALILIIKHLTHR
jgi:hypothetical protein